MNEGSANADSVSKIFFESLFEDEERHYNQYYDEMENMRKFGANYSALHSIERSKNIAPADQKNKIRIAKML